MVCFRLLHTQHFVNSYLLAGACSGFEKGGCLRTVVVIIDCVQSPAKFNISANMHAEMAMAITTMTQLEHVVS